MATIDRFLSEFLFEADLSGRERLTRRSYVLSTAQQLGYKENWLQLAIEEDPEIVLAPCRAAGLVDADERWAFWAREFSGTDAGIIDLLLLSESGRIAIVETKLAYNPEARRAVAAQILEYAIHLPLACMDDMPDIPKVENGTPLVDAGTVESRLEEGDYLLIIAGDQLDPRAIKLSQAMLSKHMVHSWDLALVEVAIYERQDESDHRQHLLVPHLAGVIAVDERRTFRVVVDENRTTVKVEQLAGTAGMIRQKWNEERFFAEAERSAEPLRHFADELRRLRQSYPGITFDYGSSKAGSLIFRKDGSNILEFNISAGGFVRFRPTYFDAALGPECAEYYRRSLESIFPRSMKMKIPLAYFESDGAASVLPLLEVVLQKSEMQRAHSDLVGPPH